MARGEKNDFNSDGSYIGHTPEMDLAINENKKNRIIQEEFKDFWLFGEMQLDLTKSAKDIYAKAFDIAENCGYWVEINKNWIDIYGEDVEDQYIIVNRLFIKDDRVYDIHKILLEESDRSHIQTAVYLHGNWVKLVT